MEAQKMYELPKLPYDYNALEPHMSEQLLKLHHDKHHAAYVSGANGIFEKMDAARLQKADVDVKAMVKELSFHIGGHVLHSLFWENLSPSGRQGGGGKPSGTIAQLIDQEFGSFERFKKMFTQAAMSVEGSGWAALAFCMKTGRPMLMQIEKHNVNVFPTFKILMVLDAWEHAYYLDYKNEKAKFFDAFWSVVNWDQVGRRADETMENKIIPEVLYEQSFIYQRR